MEMASSRTFSLIELHKRGFSEWPFLDVSTRVGVSPDGGLHQGDKHPDHTHHSYSLVQAILNPGKQPAHHPQGISYQAGPYSERAK